MTRPRLNHSENLIGLHVFQFLVEPTGPAHFNSLHVIICAQAEMDPFVTGRKIAARSAHNHSLRGAGDSFYLDFGSDSITIADRSPKLDQEPVPQKL